VAALLELPSADGASRVLAVHTAAKDARESFERDCIACSRVHTHDTASEDAPVSLKMDCIAYWDIRFLYNDDATGAVRWLYGARHETTMSFSLRL
jgi:hypothetical protein